MFTWIKKRVTSEAKEEFLKAQERQFETETLFKPKLKLYRKINRYCIVVLYQEMNLYNFVGLMKQMFK